MIDIILLIILLGLGTSYILELFILEKMDSHTGPFQSKKREVFFLSELVDDEGFQQAEHYQTHQLPGPTFGLPIANHEVHVVA